VLASDVAHMMSAAIAYFLIGIKAMRILNVSDNIIARASTVFTEAISAPGTTSLINLSSEAPSRVKATAPAANGTSTVAPISVEPTFKLVFLSVLGITILCGVGVIVLASLWVAPTDPQKSAIEAVGFAWKAGLGAIFGLLGGKVT